MSEKRLKGTSFGPAVHEPDRFESVAAGVLADMLLPLYENIVDLAQKHVLRTSSHEPEKFVQPVSPGEWVASLDGHEIARGPMTSTSGTVTVYDPSAEGKPPPNVVTCPGCKSVAVVQKIPKGQSRVLCTTCKSRGHGNYLVFPPLSYQRMAHDDAVLAASYAADAFFTRLHAPPVGIEPLCGYHESKPAILCLGPGGARHVPCEVRGDRNGWNLYESTIRFEVTDLYEQREVADRLRLVCIERSPLDVQIANKSWRVTVTSMSVDRARDMRTIYTLNVVPMANCTACNVPMEHMVEHTLAVPDKNADDNIKAFILCAGCADKLRGADVAHVNGHLVWAQCGYCKSSLPKSNKDGLCTKEDCKKAHPRPEWVQTAPDAWTAEMGPARAVIVDDGWMPTQRTSWGIYYEGRRVHGGTCTTIARAKVIAGVWLDVLRESGPALKSLLGMLALVFRVWDESPTGQLRARDELIAREAANVPDGCDPRRWRRVVDVITAWFWLEDPAERAPGKEFDRVVAGVLSNVRAPLTAYVRTRSFRYTPAEATRRAVPEGQMTLSIQRAFRAYDSA